MNAIWNPNPCCGGPARPPAPPAPPPPPPWPEWAYPPARPTPCEGSFTILGTDGCGNLIICIKRQRMCEVNGCPTPCRRYY